MLTCKYEVELFEKVHQLLPGGFISHFDLCWGPPTKQVSISKHNLASFFFDPMPQFVPYHLRPNTAWISAPLLSWFHSLHYRGSHLLRIFSTFLSLLFLIVSISSACLAFYLPKTCLSSLADSGGRVYAVRHDGRDQTQLDRSSEEERPAQRLSRSHTVTRASMWNEGTWPKFFT